MWKKRMLCLVLVLCAVLLTACQEKETFATLDSAGQDRKKASEESSQQDPFENAVVDSVTEDYDNGPYNPALEEDKDPEPVPEPEVPMTAPPTMQSEYAGATPVLIDPIDKPTPTPLPPLTFIYDTYEASALHLTFEAPGGWLADDSQPDTFTLTNPDPSMDYAASLSIRLVPVSKNYSKNELIKEVKNTLDTLGSEGFKKFERSNTAGRKFMNSDGIYANYTGTTTEGVKIAGRLIVSCVNKTLYVLHVSYPQGYTKTYVDGVYDKFRHTVKTTD